MLNPLPNSILEKYPEGSVTQWFGENKELYLKAIGMPGHPGTDIFQPYGTPIIAPYNGRISGVHLQDTNKIGGNQIDLFSDIQPSDFQTNGLVCETMFAHCSKILVQKDQRVKAGDIIGKVGNSGFVISGGIQYWQNSNPDNRGRIFISACGYGSQCAKAIWNHWSSKILIMAFMDGLTRCPT